MRVAVRADRRFRRAHVTPSRRRRWVRPWPLAIGAMAAVALCLYAISRTAAIAAASDALTIARITVSGTNRMSRGEALAILAGVRGSSMVTVDLEGWRRKLLESPWVADAAIRRVLPGTLAVAITEREPMAIGRIDGRLYVVDREGTIVDEFGPNYSEIDLPIVDGLAALPSSGGPLVDADRAALAARLLQDLERSPAIAEAVSQIDVTDVRGASVILDGDTTLVRVGDQRFVERIQSYLDIREALRERVPEIDYVDLRFDERVYVRPQGGKRGS